MIVKAPVTKTAAKKAAAVKKPAASAGVKITQAKAPKNNLVPVKAPLKAVAAKKPAKSVQKDGVDTLAIVMQALDQDKGQNILTIDLKGKTSIADYMVIVTGTSSRQVSAMASKLRDRLAKEGRRAKLEGMTNGDWVIVDAFDVIVHIFKPEVRDFYNLEKLWGSDFSTVGYNLYTSK